MQPSTARKLATMVFADLIGSTAIADSQDPEQCGRKQRPLSGRPSRLRSRRRREARDF